MNKQLSTEGYLITSFPLPENLLTLVGLEDWNQLDQEFQQLTNKDGKIFQFLQDFHPFSSIEFIISLRDSLDPDQEDGIWHDDGSRLMAFSLSLTLEPFEGGLLEIKNNQKNQHAILKTPEYGQGIIFLTGEYGYIHKINRVTKGKRLIIAGWCK